MNTVSLSLDDYNKLRTSSELIDTLQSDGEVFYCEGFNNHFTRIITKDEAVKDMIKRLNVFQSEEFRRVRENRDTYEQLLAAQRHIEELKHQLVCEERKKWYQKLFK